MLLPMWWSDWFGSYGPMPWMFFGPVMMLMFVAVGVAGIYLLLRASGPPRRRGSRAAEILMERYARGEIDQAEFEERRRILQA